MGQAGQASQAGGDKAEGGVNTDHPTCSLPMRSRPAAGVPPPPPPQARGRDARHAGNIMKFSAARAGDSAQITSANTGRPSSSKSGRTGMNCPDLAGSSPRTSSRGDRVQFPRRTRRPHGNHMETSWQHRVRGTIDSPRSHGGFLMWAHAGLGLTMGPDSYLGLYCAAPMERDGPAGGVEASATLVHSVSWYGEV
jgi:hypothetical protein